MRERRNERLLSLVAVSTDTGARDDTLTGLAGLRDLEEAIWGARDLRGGVLRSLSPDAPIIAPEEEIARLNRALEVVPSITRPLEVTGGPSPSSLDGEGDFTAATWAGLFLAVGNAHLYH